MKTLKDRILEAIEEQAQHSQAYLKLAREEADVSNYSAAFASQTRALQFRHAQHVLQSILEDHES